MPIARIIEDIKRDMSKSDLDEYKRFLKINLRDIDRMIVVFPVVRGKFLELVDDKRADEYLKGRLLSEPKQTSDEPIAKTIEFMRQFDPAEFDDCNPDHVYSLFHLAKKAATGALECFYWMDREGKATNKEADTLFYPFRQAITRELQKWGKEEFERIGVKIIPLKDEKDIKKKLPKVFKKY